MLCRDATYLGIDGQCHKFSKRSISPYSCQLMLGYEVYQMTHRRSIMNRWVNIPLCTTGVVFCFIN